MTRPITVEGQELSMASLQIQHGSPLVNTTVASIEQDAEVSVVLLRRGNEISDFHPAPERILAANDSLVVLGGATEISSLAQKNNSR